jgi:hypothetical protein
LGQFLEYPFAEVEDHHGDDRHSAGLIEAV